MGSFLIETRAATAMARPIVSVALSRMRGSDHESQPFEAYRELLGAMRRYQNSMTIPEGCRFVM